MEAIKVVTLTVDELADMMKDAALTAIERWENRKDAMDFLKSLSAIADYLGVSTQTVVKNYRQGLYGGAIRRHGRNYCASKRELLSAIEATQRDLKQYTIAV